MGSRDMWDQAICGIQGYVGTRDRWDRHRETIVIILENITDYINTLTGFLLDLFAGDFFFFGVSSSDSSSSDPESFFRFFVLGSRFGAT